MNKWLPLRKILLAEDDEDDYTVFKEILDEIDSTCALAWVHDGVELMRQLKETTPPDIIFLDINMPRKNGFQCIDFIRNELRLEIPVIIYSTTVDIESIRKMYFYKADMYICKPNSYAAMKDFLQRSLTINWRELKLKAKDFILSENHSLINEFIP